MIRFAHDTVLFTPVCHVTLTFLVCMLITLLSDNNPLMYTIHLHLVKDITEST
jgi:hypothetical protein